MRRDNRGPRVVGIVDLPPMVYRGRVRIGWVRLAGWRAMRWWLCWWLGVGRVVSGVGSRSTAVDVPARLDSCRPYHCVSDVNGVGDSCAVVRTATERVTPPRCSLKKMDIRVGSH